MAMIEVDGLRKSYGAFEALRGVSLSVGEGETVAVLGPNGAGKTTMVEILEGYRRRDAGQVRVLGIDPAGGGVDYRQGIGIVLQSSGIDPYLTVGEVVQMYAECYRRPRPVREVIALVGLEEKTASRVQSLSGGQQRRLDLALGLVGDPVLLFLDEPTTGFDPTARRQAWEVVHSLVGLGKTILLTTHYMDEAQALADRVIVIAAGEIVAEGPPESIGGRGDAPALIRFSLPEGFGVGDLPLVAALDSSATVSVETADPTTALWELTRWAVERGISLADLTVSRPSLEDVYLQLTANQPEGPA